MQIQSQVLIYFSPTQTTRRVVHAVAEGTTIEFTEQLDLTPPEIPKDGITEITGKLAIIGAPVYGGRIALEAVNRLKAVRGNETPAVIIAVYGNREYEDALLELRNLSVDAGFVPVAAGAFIGEHSFSSIAEPIAHLRPDAIDLRIARDFGRRVSEKLTRLEAPLPDLPLEVPGNNPHKERRVRTGVSPVTKAEGCVLCGRCAEVCPMGAITITDDGVITNNLCILCCACIKNCTSGTREMQDADIRKAAGWLHAKFSERKEPETFFQQ